MRPDRRLDALCFNGLKVVESVYLTEPGEPMSIPRTWKERLWSWPWRPWQATRIIIPQVPQRGGTIIGDTIYMHPATVQQVRELRELLK